MIESDVSTGYGAPRSECFYQVYVRSFADSDGDGVGDLEGLRSRLAYIGALGVDGILLSPCFASPQFDHGYDVADYFKIDPLYGTLPDMDLVLAEAHRRNLLVLLDIIPNHCSSKHAWFETAVRSQPGSPLRQRFLFARGRGPHGDSPPNNWRSYFGGPAWSRSPRDHTGEWYFHLFGTEQPDFNWRSTDVQELFDRVLEFWLHRGVDGFRIDAAHALCKAAGLPDVPGLDQIRDPNEAIRINPHIIDQPEVHEVWRRWRALINSLKPEARLVGEIWVDTPQAQQAYLGPDELHEAFVFGLMYTPWTANALAETIRSLHDAFAANGRLPSWVLSTHDESRVVTRMGNGHVGLSRARGLALLALALPGNYYLYNGEELGLPTVDISKRHIQDPLFALTGRTRDGCRVPLPWTIRSQSNYGFSSRETASCSWLPQPDWWGELSLEAQEPEFSSTLSLYRQALILRRRIWGGLHSLQVDDAVVSFHRGNEFMCITNTGDTPKRLNLDGDVLLVSEGRDSLWLPSNATLWLRTRS